MLSGFSRSAAISLPIRPMLMMAPVATSCSPQTTLRPGWRLSTAAAQLAVILVSVVGKLGKRVNDKNLLWEVQARG